MEVPSLPYYNQLKKAMLQMENWATRLNHRMELGPWHVPISHKMHTQPCISIRNSNYTQAFAQVMLHGHTHTGAAYLNWILPSRLMPECCQGTALSPFVGAPMEKRIPKLPLIDFVWVASIETTIAPVERVKLLMQNQNALIQSGRLSQPYKGVFDCFARIIHNEGFISLWRGNTARIIATCSMKVIDFSAVSYAASRNGRWDDGGLLALGGLLAASPLVGYALSYAGTRMTNDIKTTSKLGKRQFNGIVDVWRKTVTSDGIAGLYRGFVLSTIKNKMRPIASQQLASVLKPWLLLSSLGLQDNDYAISAVSLAIVVCTRMAFYPMDTVCTRMMMTSGETIKFKNTFDAFSQIYRNEGLKSFYNGTWAAILGLVVILVFSHLSGPGGPNMGKRNGSDDGGKPTSTFTARWRKGNGEHF
ncbi:hypothetical protein PTKIN_Ptkin18bG0121900 [Pterospermum kingtungense]